MPLNPPPTIQLGLGLITQPLLRNDMTRQAEVTFAVNVSAGASPADAQDTIDDFQANFNANWGPLLDTQVTIIAPTIKLGDGGTTPFEAVGSGAVTTGGAVGTKMPPNVALLMKKTTGIAGRANHGRTYFPFVLEDPQVNENGTILAGSQTVFDGAGAAFLAQLTTDLTLMVIAHKSFNVPLPPHFVTAVTTGPLVTAYKSETLVATQRRRLGR